MTNEVAVREDDGIEVRTQMQPADLLSMAAKQATALAEVIEKKKLFTMIGQKKHVSVEGWQTLGAMNQLQAFTERVEVTKNEDGSVEATALVSARRVTDGVAIAQAEGFCSTKEARWKGRDEYAVRSMAQTRATSKVFRQALAWVMVLAGYEATPSEEVPTPAAPEPPKPEPPKVEVVPQIDEETRVLLEKHVIGNEAKRNEVREWMRSHGYPTPKVFYERVTNEEAMETLTLVGFDPFQILTK